MFYRFRFFILLSLVCALFACKKAPAEYPLAGAPIGKPAETARIKEGSMLLRGLDDERLSSLELPNPYADYVYVIKPGRHRLMGMNIQSGHVLIPTDLRCYSLEAELLPGVDYLLVEDKEKEMAHLKREDTGAIVASGEKYEQKDPYSGACTWGK
ncbi:hypothetical protein NB640_00535 [Oxalobacter vibrioformis]|uniref:Lipoprotein n=1 Tax=Oxalobacter vibrioformis TaxID=933080 RepID=A0A9E9LXP8_9BURK|nr:hypothetical protein [Oxalobacter vibrioformis]WAW10196.1 hypothetical protein NB640_00535 [Oxalobacter vibrioformis]